MKSQLLQLLQTTIQEDLQRVITFLIQRKILIAPTDNDNSSGEPRVQLYTKSKEVIGAFWQE